MRLDRRNLLLAGAGAAALGGGAAAGLLSDGPESALPPVPGEDSWARLRGEFLLRPDQVDMSAMLITAHPGPVRDAVARHREGLDTNPIEYLERDRQLQNESRRRAGEYFGVEAPDVALTESTTMGAGLVYNGLKLTPEQEVLTTDQDYYVTHESLRLASERGGASVRRVPLYDDAATVTADGLTDSIIRQIAPRTRVVALTWVHSSTGVKLPLAAIAAAIASLNGARDAKDKILLCVDGVHGFGNQDVDFAGLGCDFFFSGCHKWLFGPRGTGVVFGSGEGWAAMAPTIPTFLDGDAYSLWMAGEAPEGCSGARLTPGGFKAFEHVWSLADAFQLHHEFGRRQIAERTAALATQLKEGLKAMPHVTLRTPLAHDLSAGIVSFDVAGMGAETAVAHLRRARLLASAAPYARSHVRLTPSVRNSPAEIEFALKAVRALA